MMQPCESTPVTELVYVKVGEAFTVSLASNPTTGFGWTLVEALPYWLEQTDYQFRALPSDPGTTGTGGFEEWTYRPKAVASTMLLYEYAQPWAGNVLPAKTHSVLVMAQAPDTGE
jgi:predicted secreted protein